MTPARLLPRSLACGVRSARYCAMPRDRYCKWTAKSRSSLHRHLPSPPRLNWNPLFDRLPRDQYRFLHTADSERRVVKNSQCGRVQLEVLKTSLWPKPTPTPSPTATEQSDQAQHGKNDRSGIYFSDRFIVPRTGSTHEDQRAYCSKGLTFSKEIHEKTRLFKVPSCGVNDLETQLSVLARR